MDSFSEYVPEVLKYIVDEEALSDDVHILPASFVEEGIENPFVFLEFWLPGLLLALLFLLVVFPLSIMK